ncbi:MAG: hypothetical protein LWW99_11885, partial [Deltaproteobacteria bacterium]|nr:hypothetical protein [Deltaproteobacteria bacterium]
PRATARKIREAIRWGLSRNLSTNVFDVPLSVIISLHILVTDHRVLLLETICVSPVVFLVFAVWETPAPERSGGEQGGSHAGKASENKGREHVGKRSAL